MVAFYGVLKTYFFKGGVQMSSGMLTLSQCSLDISQVINRVRGAFGGIPMKAVADLPEIKAAEGTIDRASRLVIRGVEGLEVWRGALIVYESTWMTALKDLRASGKWAA
ncbi:MAG: hypothetical protein ACI8V2_001282 [Candidatus Latescibacterota bacterium]|jgi:hypothetical protein